MQYHASNLAPTARYQELSRIDSRFAGRGPALFTDYDEYALYSLRDLDVGGPDFMYPAPLRSCCRTACRSTSTGSRPRRCAPTR